MLPLSSSPTKGFVRAYNAPTKPTQVAMMDGVVAQKDSLSCRTGRKSQGKYIQHKKYTYSGLMQVCTL